MKRTSPRLHEVSPSEFPWEREGLELLLDAVPDASPYQVWTNFSFIDNHGQWHEVDALVVGRGRIHLVELKSWEGLFRGNEHQLEVTGLNGHTRTQRNPLKTTRSKAQRFATRLGDMIDQIAKSGAELGIHYTHEDLRTPWVQEALFLHGDRVHSQIGNLGAQNIFGRDGAEETTKLPGISERLTEAPGHDLINEKRSRDVLEVALTQITGKIQKKRKLMAGNWELKKQLEHDDDYVVWSTTNQLHDQRGIAFVSDRIAEQDPLAVKRRDKQLRQSYTMLAALNHDGIDKPMALESFSETGAPVVIYPRYDGFEQIDLLLPGLKLTAEQQVDLVLKIADAVSYAHDNGVVHRRLAPSAILLDTKSLKGDDPQVRIKVSRWSTVGEVEADGTRTYLPTATSTAYDGHTVFLPPEGFNAGVDRRLNELFSIGALAYFIFSGGEQPAFDQAQLLARLKEHQGLDLQASKATVEAEVSELVLSVTSPVPNDRLKLIMPKKGGAGARLQNPVSLFADSLRETTTERRTHDGADALHPTIGGLIDGRFSIHKVLGSGSTAMGLRVSDGEADDEQRVLKVGLGPEKAGALKLEAEALQELGHKLGDSPARKHFVSLLDGPLYLPYDRTALLLRDCGSYTLTDTLQLGGPPEEGFWNYSRQLLDILVALESTGVVHRDIKPSNLGLQTAGNKQKIMIFDFSLSKEPLDNVSAGSPPYQDPFLVAHQQGRTHFDSHAERYSMAVVLLQMAAQASPVYGDGSTNPATLKDQSLQLDDADLRPYIRGPQRPAMLDFFRTALNGDVTKRYASAEDMRSAFLDIRDLKSEAFSGPPAKKPKPEPAPADLSRRPDSPSIDSFSAFAEHVIAYSGKKNTVSRRYVQHALAQAERELEDPFSPATGYAELLDSSVQRIHQLAAELPTKWSDSTDLVETFQTLANSVEQTLRSVGGIATPSQLNQAIVAVLSEDAVDQTMREQQGVLRLVELWVNREGTVLHPSRRCRQHALVAFASDAALAGLPKSLEDAATTLLKSGDSALIPSERLRSTLAEAASDYLAMSVTNLPVNASRFPELATSRSSKVSITSSGELYSPDIDVETMLRDIIHPSTDAITPSLLKRTIETRFPDAKRSLPRNPELAELIIHIAPDFQWNEHQHKFLRSRESSTISVETRMPTSTMYHGARPLSEVAPGLRDLFASLEPTISTREFRVVPAALGFTHDVVAALVNQFGAARVSVGDEILDDLHQRMINSNQAELFDTFLSFDNDESRGSLKQIVKDAAKSVFTNAEHQEAPAVILSDVSILTRFESLDLLKRWTDISAGPNERAIWLVLPHEGPDDSNVNIEGESIPGLTSPSQTLPVVRPTF